MKRQKYIVVLDSDRSGNDFKNKLLDYLYKGSMDRVLSVQDYTRIENSEIEDLLRFKSFCEVWIVFWVFRMKTMSLKQKKERLWFLKSRSMRLSIIFTCEKAGK